MMRTNKAAGKSSHRTGHLRMTSTATWRESGSYFEFDGYRIFHRVDGDPAAPVLVLVHGFPTASWDYEKVWPELTKRYRVVTLDMLGFGFSDKPYRHDYSIIEQADIFDKLMRKVGVGDYHLFAHDYGASVGQELIARDLEGGRRPRLRSVCFLNGGLFPETHRKIFTQKLLLSPLGPLASLLTSKASVGRDMKVLFGPKVPPSAATIDGVWELMMCNRGTMIMHRLIRYIPDRIDHRDRWVAAIQRRDIPIRLIDGMLDPVSGAHMARHYRELVPDADVVELSDIGHYPQVQAPKAVLKAYFDFRDRPVSAVAPLRR